MRGVDRGRAAGAANARPPPTRARPAGARAYGWPPPLTHAADAAAWPPPPGCARHARVAATAGEVVADTRSARGRQARGGDAAGSESGDALHVVRGRYIGAKRVGGRGCGPAAGGWGAAGRLAARAWPCLFRCKRQRRWQPPPPVMEAPQPDIAVAADRPGRLWGGGPEGGRAWGGRRRAWQCGRDSARAGGRNGPRLSSCRR